MIKYSKNFVYVRQPPPPDPQKQSQNRNKDVIGHTGITDVANVANMTQKSEPSRWTGLVLISGLLGRDYSQVAPQSLMTINRSLKSTIESRLASAAQSPRAAPLAL